MPVDDNELNKPVIQRQHSRKVLPLYRVMLRHAPSVYDKVCQSVSNITAQKPRVGLLTQGQGNMYVPVYRGVCCHTEST